MKQFVAALLFCISAAAVSRTALDGTPLPSDAAMAKAEQQGQLADAAALENLVALGEPALILRFGAGMSNAQIELSPEIEAIVIAHFDDKRVGAALRAMTPRYHTRKLFDLHYARVMNAYDVSEPSIGQILNTNQPGIDEDLLKLAPKLPKNERGIDRFTFYVALRRHPAAIPLLLDALPGSFPKPNDVSWNPAFDGLLAYPLPHVWRRTSVTLDEMHRQGRVTDEVYRRERTKLDTLLKDPNAALAQMRQRDAREQYQRRIGEVDFARGRRELLKTSDPSAYLVEQERFVVMQDAVGRDVGMSDFARNSGNLYFSLGMFARFRAHDAPTAVRLFASAAERGIEIAQVAIADTYQFGLEDHKAAITAFEKALQQARKPVTTAPLFDLYEGPGTAVNTWWQAWFAHEIEYLRTSQPYRGAISEAEIAGFFEAMLNKRAAVTSVFIPEIFVNTRMPDANGRNVRGTWSTARGQVMGMKRETLQARLDAIPSSHLALMAVMSHASALGDAEAILAYFVRNDPAGYWSACAFGTIAYLDALGERRREEAVRNESAELLPGMTLDEDPRPLSVAARRFMEQRKLRINPAGT